jgi:AbrB family looped-hinge helix DNA binding protein
MTVASITSKHQITIPAAVRREMNLRRGDRLIFERAGSGKFRIAKARVEKSDGAAVPFLGRRQQPLNQSEMEEAIRAGVLKSIARRE